jgi:hypothetical protein
MPAATLKNQQQQSITTKIQTEIAEGEEQWEAGIKQQQQLIQRTALEAYGFVGNYNESRRHSAYNHLAKMPHWYYFNCPTHISFHYFITTIKPRQNLRRLLGLGHKFIPAPRWTQNGASASLKEKTLKRFEHNLQLVCCFGSDPIKGSSSLTANDNTGSRS